MDRSIQRARVKVVDKRSAKMFKFFLVVFFVGIVVASIYGIYYFKFARPPGEVIGEIELPGNNVFEYEFTMPFDGNIFIDILEVGEGVSESEVLQSSQTYNKISYLCDDKHRHDKTPLLDGNSIAVYEENKNIIGRNLDNATKAHDERLVCRDGKLYGKIVTEFLTIGSEILSVSDFPEISPSVFIPVDGGITIANIYDLSKEKNIKLRIKTSRAEVDEDVEKSRYEIIMRLLKKPE